MLWLLLLFRVLSSTAENFFSPILTQLSQEMGLPPRFAGGVLSKDSQKFSVHCSGSLTQMLMQERCPVHA